MNPLYDTTGNRLYLNKSERAAFLDAASRAPRNVRSFCEVLHYTGCRISEALALTGASIDFEDEAIIIHTLKKRREGVYRAVPVPFALLDTLNLVHGLKERKTPPTVHLWPWSRTTAWRHVKKVLNEARIVEGAHASPKGLRHGFGVAAISSGVPLNTLCELMGHASMETTAIYANVLGEEKRQIISRMWGEV